MDTFSAAAREWQALLREAGEAFVARHLEAAMQLAVALHSQQDAEAERAAAAVSSAERRDFLALATLLRRLLEAAVREHLTFLLPAADKRTELKTELKTRQQAIVQSLPDAFQLRFRQLLERHWAALTQAAESTSFSLPRVQQLHWKVAPAAVAAAAPGDDAGRRILVRLQTSDGKTRTMLVPLRQFHQLRHSAATVLQEMNQAEAHPMMRLAYMEQSSRAAASAP
ncbi:Carboxypeptidase Y A [Phytophthora cinnamomi]|uniref:Carboxypeptidase Y A n=1 Tax=Phytophthora cinnamomi TaxID=4785 RepID=UPI0035595953|nr:Carboxypeptidase Y A [Phytophthora cinnamomi]